MKRTTSKRHKYQVEDIRLLKFRRKIARNAAKQLAIRESLAA